MIELLRASLALIGASIGASIEGMTDESDRLYDSPKSSVPPVPSVPSVPVTCFGFEIAIPCFRFACRSLWIAINSQKRQLDST